MIADSVAFLVGAGQARHLRRRALLRRLRATTPATRCDCLRAAAGAGAETRRAVRHQRRRRCRTQIAEATAAVVAARRRPASRVGIHCHNDAECGVANSLAAVEAGATQVQGTMNGVGERTRQRQPRLDHRQPPAEDGLPSAGPTSSCARLTETAHFVDELLNLHARPATSPTSGATRSPTRAACTSPASAPTPRRSSTSTRRVVGNARELLVSELAGQGTRSPSGPRRPGVDARRRRRRARRRARQGARAPRLPVRGRRRLVRAAAAQETGDVRAAVPPGVLARDRREARRRQGRDRGDDQDLGRRRALRAHRRGQRPGQRARRARCATRSARSTRTSRDIELVNYKVRILDEDQGTGAITRVLHRRLRRPRRRGARSASTRTSSRRRGRRSSTRWSTAMQPGARPAAQRRRRTPRERDATPSRSRSPGRSSGAEEEARCSRCCARASSRSGRACPAFEEALRRARSARAHASAVSSGTAGAAPGAARGRRGATATRSSPRRSRSWPAPTRSLYERARPVFADIDPRHAEPRPGGRGGGDHRAHDGAAAGAHLRLPGRPAGLRAHRACRSSRTPARRSAPCTPTARAVGARGHPAVVRLLRQQAADHRRGRDGHARRRRRSRSASTPSATRAARPTWAGSTTTAWASTTA